MLYVKKLIWWIYYIIMPNVNNKFVLRLNTNTKLQTPSFQSQNFNKNDRSSMANRQSLSNT